MIPFREITPDDAPIVRRYAMANHIPNCDLCFANIYGWQPLYQTRMAEWRGWLLFSFMAGRHPAFMMPLNDGHEECKIEEVFEELRKQSYPHPLLVMGMTQEEADRFGQEHWQPNYDDYIYDRASLESLSGKRLQPKRNHANRFDSEYPEARLCPLEHIDECLAFASLWGLSEEMDMMRRVLPLRDKLDIRGLELWVGDRLVAFAFGAPIDENCFDVMVEKADRDFEGAYAVINREFVKSLPPQYTLINREEDLGIEGLRHAKMSYHPVERLHKYNVWEKVKPADEH